MSVGSKRRLNPWYISIPSNPNLYSTKIIIKCDGKQLQPSFQYALSATLPPSYMVGGRSCQPKNTLFSLCVDRKTNTGATEVIPALNQSWRGCNHPTSNRPYKGHQVPYLVPRTAECFSPLWSNTDHWPYAPGVCSVTGMLWWILHSWLIEYPLRDNSRDLHSGIPARSGILLSDMTQLTSTSPQTWTI